MRFRSHRTLALFLLAVLAASADRRASAAPVLTGAGLFPTDDAGRWGGLHLWNTQTEGFLWNLFLTDGDPATGAFINGPTDAQIVPAIELTPGTHRFGMLGLHPTPGTGYDTGFAALNLYLDDGTSPAISVFGPTGPAAGTASLISGPVPGPLGEPATGAGTLSYSDGQYNVEVTSFQFDTNPAVDVDRVSAFDVGPSGTPNLYGVVTLTVTAVPEPSALLGMGLLAPAALPQRRLRPVRGRQ